MAFSRDGTVRKGYSASATTVATDSTFNLSTGRLVVVAVQSFFTFNFSWSVSDTAGNTYTALTRYIDGDSTSGVQLFYCLSTTSANASNTWTASYGETANEPTIAVMVYSYSGTATLLDSDGAGGNSAAPASPAITAGDCAVAAVKHFSAETTTVGSGWTEQWDQVNGGPYFEDRIDSPGGTITPQISLSASAQWAIAGASFSNDAGGGGSSPVLMGQICT